MEIGSDRRSSLKGRERAIASSFHASFLQAIDGVMSLALCPQVVSQASQHFRSSEKQATRDGCFARQSVCSVASLHSGMSKAVHPQELSKVDVDQQMTSVTVGMVRQVIQSTGTIATIHINSRQCWDIKLCGKDGDGPSSRLVQSCDSRLGLTQSFV